MKKDLKRFEEIARLAKIAEMSKEEHDLLKLKQEIEKHFGSEKAYLQHIDNLVKECLSVTDEVLKQMTKFKL